MAQHADPYPMTQTATVKPSAAGAGGLPELLQEAAEQVGRLGAEFKGDRIRLDALRQRLQEERCYLAVLGQFKRGKSTLVNALLGEAVLPAAVVPVTSIPTFLHGGREISARVLFDNGKEEERFSGSEPRGLAEFLAHFVTESANPHNRLGVQLVEATYPAPVLREGLALIDTPGIGSTFRHNTEATLRFLPQCDAALFVVSADPPITEVEVDFLKLVRQKLARAFFILNKVDYLDADERRHAVAFLERVLCEQVGFASAPPIFCASAREGLEARRNGDAAAWRRSGLAEVEEQILDFLLTEKTGVLSRAVSRQAGDVLADAQRRVELILHSLQMPLTELDERIRLFEESLITIEEKGIVAMERLRREEERLEKFVRGQADELLPRSRRHLQGVVKASQEREAANWSEESAGQAVAADIPGFFEHEFGVVHDLCEQKLREALRPHQRQAAELIASVHQLVARLFGLPFEPVQQEIALATAERPAWRTHKWVIKFGAIPASWIDRILPRRVRSRRIRRRIMEQVEYLVSRNVGDLQWATLENLTQSVQNFREKLESGLQEAIRATRGAIQAARRRRREDSASATPEIARLKSAASDLQAIRQDLVQR